MPSIINATTTNGVAISPDNSGSLQLATNNGTTAVTIDTNQNVGIGTSSPAAPLDVVTTSSALGIALRGRSSDNISNMDFESNNGATVYGQIQGRSTDFRIQSNSTLPTTFFTNGGERMRIDSSGNVGIGNNTVSNIKVYVSTDSNQAGFYVRAQNASQTQGVLQVESARNTTNNTYYAIQYYNSSAGADRFRVADSGNVTNTNGSYGTISDVKNKENIVDATPKLDKVNQLKVRNFNFKGDDLKQIGFVAQEFEQVFPSMIEEHKDTDAEGNNLGTTTKSIKTSVLVPILVKAIQELKAELDATKAEVQALKGAA